MTDWNQLWNIACAHYKLGDGHGPDHWGRVEKWGVTLVRHTAGADAELVRIFAILHDCRRSHEDGCWDHGARAAVLANKLNGTVFDIGRSRFVKLQVALAWHSWGKVQCVCPMHRGDPTIACCWDADRLDLTRYGIAPKLHLLGTPLGKALAKRYAAVGHWEPEKVTT